MSQTYRIELDNGTTTRELVTETDRAITELDVVREHTGLSDFEAPVRLTDYSTIESNFVGPNVECFIYVNNELIFRGFAMGLEGDEKSGEAVLTGPDVFARLRRDNEVNYTVSSTDATYNVIDDFWDKTAFTHAVQPPTPTTIVTNKTTHDIETTSEWKSATGNAGTNPPYATPIFFNGNFGMRQHSWTVEGEDYNTSTGVLVPSNGTAIGNPDNYSGGSAVAIDDDPNTAAGLSALYSFTPAYDIPNGDFDVAVRSIATNATGQLDVTVLDSNLNTLASSSIPADDTLGWDSVKASGGDFSNISLTAANQYSVELAANSAGFDIDVVQPHDDRYGPYDYDNNNGGSGGYLTGPELYSKDGIEYNLSPFLGNSSNIESATVSSTWPNGTDYGSQLGVSNNGLQLYSIFTGTGGTTNFNTFGTNMYPRVTLSGQGSRTTATPKEGYNTGVIDSLTITIDGNDIDVLESGKRFDGSYLEILNRMHERAGYRYAADYQSNSLVVNSFPRGATNTASWTTKNRSRVLDTDGYANQVRVLGPEGQGYPEALAENEAEVNAKGAITWFIKDPNVESVADAKARARKELSKRVEKDTLSATVEIFPAKVRPGYAYSVTNFAQDMDLERVVYRERPGGATGRLEFEVSPVLSEKTTESRRDIDNTNISL
jgi:hypothetical protein